MNKPLIIRMLGELTCMLHFMMNFSLCEAINTAKKIKNRYYFMLKSKFTALLHAKCCRTQAPSRSATF